ncbi:prepilin peptidase [Edwardsiella hoshinae]|uniref:Pectic enzymes secretion protein outO n=1 Tax=Edwardsiella hoshinae TaxID=93378 RepID=A0A376DC02_9GAMM|nr:A24 family peptidase [Edwardsiella hoshinae]QPR27564.1 prepilin peptidase [Edwardsiella hoshinae]STC86825.1 Pectic enzymes secretion protein outO [Edwardsiella hoshinae]
MTQDGWFTLAAMLGFTLGFPLHRLLCVLPRPLLPPLGWYDRHFPPFPSSMALACGLAAIALVLANRLPPGGVWLCGLGFCSLSLGLALLDRAMLLLPDQLTLGLLWLGLFWQASYRPVTLPDAVFGVLTGYLLLWLVAWGFWRWRGIEGLGGGDAKLLAALGAWVGVSRLPTLLLAACLLALIGFAWRTWRQGALSPLPVPFGPPLVLAGVWLLLPLLPSSGA